jgi:hypothetical protein
MVVDLVQLVWSSCYGWLPSCIQTSTFYKEKVRLWRTLEKKVVLNKEFSHVLCGVIAHENLAQQHKKHNNAIDKPINEPKQ